MFDLDLLEKNSTIVIIGLRNTGKSYLIKDIVSHNKDIPLHIACEQADRNYSFYDDFINNKFIYNYCESSLIDNLFKRYELVKNDKRSMLILDRTLNSRGLWTKDETFLKLFNNNKSIETMLIMTFTFSLSVPREIMNTYDYVFLFNENFTANIKRMYEHYATDIFASFDEFREIFDKYTKNNYECLVLCLKTKKYYQYKSPKKIPKFKTLFYNYTW
jgi:AAA+ ATPase superfamily predicted ATPase